MGGVENDGNNSHVVQFLSLNRISQREMHLKKSPLQAKKSLEKRKSSHDVQFFMGYMVQ
jgi:hypothetical protein